MMIRSATESRPSNPGSRRVSRAIPKGRPSGTKNLKTDLNEELQERIWSTKANSAIENLQAAGNREDFDRQDLKGRCARGHDAHRHDV